MKKFEVNINPKLFKYALDTSGHTALSLSSKLKTKKITPTYFENLSNGVKKPQYSELIKIDSVLKRGIPFYLLESVPDEHVLKNFRMKHGGKVSPKLEIQLRKYNNLREELQYLISKSVQKSIKQKKYSATTDIKEVAKEIRNAFNFNIADYSKKSSSEVFEVIRSNIEERGIFVFKDSMDESIRGCILHDDGYPPLILINSNDDKNAEIFSLLHEYAHFLTNTPEIDSVSTLNQDNSFEKWCNEFAYHFIISEVIEQKENITLANKKNLIKEENIKNLSLKYKISMHALMVGFLNKKIISREEYLEFLRNHPYKIKRAKDESGGGNYYLTLKTRLSANFVKLVESNYIRENISSREAFEYLQVKDSNRFNELVTRVQNG